jgi:hypothetical protein
MLKGFAVLVLFYLLRLAAFAAAVLMSIGLVYGFCQIWDRLAIWHEKFTGISSPATGKA